MQKYASYFLKQTPVEIMKKKEEDRSKSSCFTTTLDLSLSNRLLQDLEQQGFAVSTPQYTVFSAKKKGVSCTLYQSGKLLVQGKNMNEFIEFYLEPEILNSFSYTYQNLEIDKTARIGVDEAGKGDFFGALCIAGVFAKEQEIDQLSSMGIRDSKTLSDKKTLKIAQEIRNTFAYHIVRIGPEKYNELYPRFSNLNLLLAWGHATVIEHLSIETKCQNVIIDQFASKHVALDALKKKNISLNLCQRTRAEEDIVVAAASILARSAFLESLGDLEKKYSVTLPKGASRQVIEAGKQIVKENGLDILKKIGKVHFKTYDNIIS